MAQRPPTLDSNNVNQSGDIRLELNAEYRFPIFGFLKGAAFVDAGNVWLVNDVTGKEPDGVFEFDQFVDQVAVGVGLGIRVDLDFLVLRLDGAVPVRKPWEGTGFDFGALNVFGSQETGSEPRLHIAIGYPF